MSRSGIDFNSFCTTQNSINVASVAANTTAEQTFTFPGVKTRDVVLCVSKPSLSAGLGIVNTRVSADNTLAITFVNATASPIDPAAETYTVIVMRPEIVPGSADALSGGNVVFP